jgi:hypothetical protein
MAYKFMLSPESLKRKFSVYVVIAKGEKDVKLYVGKTGDNREGCNPLISRCGNHFSYNKIHSQVRNKLADHESRVYTYIFDHFDEYFDDEDKRRESINRINEMERWLNEKIQERLHGLDKIELLNPYSGSGWTNEEERRKRLNYRTSEANAKLNGIVDDVMKEL